MKTKWKDQRGLSSRENSIQKFAAAASKKNRSSWKKSWRHYTFYWQPDEGRWSGISFRNQTAITDKGRQPCHLSSGDFPTEVRWWGDRRFWWKFRYKANLVQFFLSLSVTFTQYIDGVTATAKQIYVISGWQSQWRHRLWRRVASRFLGNATSTVYKGQNVRSSLEKNAYCWWITTDSRHANNV